MRLKLAIVCLVFAGPLGPAAAEESEANVAVVSLEAGPKQTMVRVETELTLEPMGEGSDFFAWGAVKPDDMRINGYHLRGGAEAVRESDPTGERSLTLQPASGAGETLRLETTTVAKAGEWVDVYVALPERRIIEASFNVVVLQGSLDSYETLVRGGAKVQRAASAPVGLGVGPAAVAIADLEFETEEPTLATFDFNGCLWSCSFTWREPGRPAGKEGQASVSGNPGDGYSATVSCYTPCVGAPFGNAGTWRFTRRGQFDHPNIMDGDMGEPVAFAYFPAVRLPL